MNVNNLTKEIKFDFEKARVNHLEWVILVKDYLKGMAVLPEKEVVSEHDCDLGKWLYQTGLAKYESITEMKELEDVHKQLHTTVTNIINLNKLGHQNETEREAEKIEIYSKTIIGLLNLIENKILIPATTSALKAEILLPGLVGKN